MHVLILQLAPMAFVAVLAGPRLFDSFDRRSRCSIGAAGCALAVSSVAPSVHSLALVASFAIGTCAVVRWMWSLSGRRWLTALTGFGCVLNLSAIVAFGAMPVREASRRLVHPTSLSEPKLVATKHVETSSDHWLIWLGDIIPVKALQAVVSIGDLMLWCAFGCLGVLLAQERFTKTQHEPNRWVILEQRSLRSP